MADEYLSGDVRAKLRMAQFAAETNPEFAVNVDALIKAQPRELEASEIDVRLGATWLSPDIIQKFMTETFQIPYYLRHAVKVRYSPYTAEWRVEGKTTTGRTRERTLSFTAHDNANRSFRLCLISEIIITPFWIQIPNNAMKPIPAEIEKLNPVAL